MEREYLLAGNVKICDAAVHAEQKVRRENWFFHFWTVGKLIRNHHCASFFDRFFQMER